MENRTRRFLTLTTNAAQILASASWAVDLRQARADYGDNFNTLVILNKGSENIQLALDANTIVEIAATGGTFSFDWEFGLNYNSLVITNTSAANAIAAEAIKVSYGRTGRD